MLRSFWYTFLLAIVVLVAIQENNRARVATLEAEQAKLAQRVQRQADEIEMQQARLYVAKAERLLGEMGAYVERLNKTHGREADCYSTSWETTRD